MSKGRVLGVDWFEGGWVAVALGGKAPTVMVGTDLAELLERVPGATCVAVDMPTPPGLPESAKRGEREVIWY